MAGISNAEILTEIRGLRADFDGRMRTIETTVALTQQTVGGLALSVKKINEVVITGNGKDPLVQTVKEIRDDLDNHLEEAKSNKKRWYDNWDKVLVGAIGAGIAILLERLGMK